jgi:hypothetical protein
MNNDDTLGSESLSYVVEGVNLPLGIVESYTRKDVHIGKFLFGQMKVIVGNFAVCLAGSVDWECDKHEEELEFGSSITSNAQSLRDVPFSGSSREPNAANLALALCQARENFAFDPLE